MKDMPRPSILALRPDSRTSTMEAIAGNRRLCRAPHKPRFWRIVSTVTRGPRDRVASVFRHHSCLTIAGSLEDP